jgi:hypothetical protein
VAFHNWYFGIGVAAAALLFATSPYAQTDNFPCDAFRMLPNGMIEVVRPVRIQGPTGVVTLAPGAAMFGPTTSFQGLNLHELYQQYCRT